MIPTIDPEFESLIPHPTPDELDELEASISSEGCRDALLTWNGILLDGHNRKAICERIGKPYETRAIELPDREAAKDWIDKNQLGRRNLSPDAMAMIRGRIYEREKARHGGDRKSNGKSSGQNDHLKKTAEIIAEKTGVSAKTVRRNAKAYRTELALKLKPSIAAKAKANEKAGGGSGNSGRQKSANPTKTRDELAKIAGVSHDTISKVERIQKSPVVELSREQLEGVILEIISETKIPKSLRKDYLGVACSKWYEIGDVPDRKRTLRDFLNKRHRLNRLGYEPAERNGRESNYIPVRNAGCVSTDGDPVAKLIPFESRLSDEAIKSGRVAEILEGSRWVSGAYDPTQEIDDLDELDRLRANIDALPPRDREMIRLELAGKTQQEIASAIRLSRKTVNEELGRIKRNLKDALWGYTHPDSPTNIYRGGLFSMAEKFEQAGVLSIGQAAKSLESMMGQGPVPPHLISSLFYQKILDDAVAPMQLGRRAVPPNSLPVIAAALRRHVKRFRVPVRGEASK